ncbi:hypothetical protein DXG03_002629 [Asterophora parasitica]|uniref:Amino acid permease/ SLC12A domain-containing protein n=1 Tax=Asterophora parasitica TaxID=117018 RepID=A0A9P7GBR3_9AGAR|nr:hypothetical protein DXG03_002629 [Asterophora parasitica]
MDYSDEKKTARDTTNSASSLSGHHHVRDETLLEPPAEETLHRGLKARQISMIALGGAVGTGLIIGSGTALRRGGPLGLLLGYSFVGFVCYLVMVALGEMASFLPHKKGFAGYATRFVDPALGFALGWNYLMKYLIVTPNNINAAGIVVQYWTRKVHVAIWMGGNPKHDRIGFRYWKAPDGPMGSYLLAQVHNERLAIFLGFWATMTNALFAFIGTELIGVTVGEAENPRRNIPIAIRRTFFRILVFYCGGVFVIGLIVPRTNDSLFIATKSKTGAAASPFVVATTLVGIKVLNHVINGAILIFVMSAANSDLYIGSRTLYGLAVEGKAPKIFKRVNRMGVPYPALILCTAVCGLVFLNVKSSGARVFTWFVNLVSTAGALTWICIAYCHLRFMKALEVQGMSRDDLPYKAPFQPWGSWFALFATALITLFKGFDTFIPFKVDTFITSVTCSSCVAVSHPLPVSRSYIGIPIFFVLWLGYRIIYKTKQITYKEIDLVTGLREIDEEEERYLAAQAARPPRTRFQKLWESL